MWTFIVYLVLIIDYVEKTKYIMRNCLVLKLVNSLAHSHFPLEKEAYMDSKILTLVWIQILTEYSIIYLKRKFNKSKTMTTIMNPEFQIGFVLFSQKNNNRLYPCGPYPTLVLGVSLGPFHLTVAFWYWRQFLSFSSWNLWFLYSSSLSL